MKFNFSLPGKGPKKPDFLEEEKPSTVLESDDDSSDMTKADLGKMVAMAIRSGDGEAIFEAVKKLCDSNPSE